MDFTGVNSPAQRDLVTALPALLQAGVCIRRDGYPAPARMDRTARKKMKKIA